VKGRNQGPICLKNGKGTRPEPARGKKFLGHRYRKKGDTMSPLGKKLGETKRRQEGKEREAARSSAGGHQKKEKKAHSWEGNIGRGQNQDKTEKGDTGPSPTEKGWPVTLGLQNLFRRLTSGNLRTNQTRKKGKKGGGKNRPRMFLEKKKGFFVGHFQKKPLGGGRRWGKKSGACFGKKGSDHDPPGGENGKRERKAR